MAYRLLTGSGAEWLDATYPMEWGGGFYLVTMDTTAALTLSTIFWAGMV